MKDFYRFDNEQDDSRLCWFCGGSLQDKKDNARFCSAECRRSFHNMTRKVNRKVEQLLRLLLEIRDMPILQKGGGDYHHHITTQIGNLVNNAPTPNENKDTAIWICSSCYYECDTPMGKCPNCGSFRRGQTRWKNLQS